MRPRLLPLLAAFALLCACGTTPAPQVEGGCRYVEHVATCRLHEATVSPASSGDPALVTVHARYDWAGEAFPAFPQQSVTVDWTVPVAGQAAALAHARAHAEVACRMGVDSGGCPPDGPRIDPAALPAPPSEPVAPSGPAGPGGPAGPSCGMSPSDWCPPAAGDACGAHPNAAECRADARCEAMPYRGESFVACQAGERCFSPNCPAVGCRTRCGALDAASCATVGAGRCTVTPSGCTDVRPCS